MASDMAKYGWASDDRFRRDVQEQSVFNNAAR